MKRLNIITLSLLSLPVFAANFVVVINENANDYSIGGFTDSKDNPEWTASKS